MKTWLQELVQVSNGRPFTQEEIMRISTAADTLPDRLAAVRKMEDCQKWLIRQLSEHISPRAMEWGLPKDPFSNDFVNLLSAVSHALIADDLELVSTTVVKPCVQLAQALDLPESEFGTLFEVAWNTLSQRCDPSSIALLKDYFRRAIDELKPNEWSQPNRATPNETRNFNLLEV